MSIQVDSQTDNEYSEDFVLTDTTAWLRIDGYVLHINNHDDRISVKLYENNKEAENDLAGFDHWKEPSEEEKSINQMKRSR
tara:strand:+ start:625 stop:867 length:243 start_codon:yes stop_codon:yes gene_type:complete